MLYRFQAVPPPIIRSSKLYTQHRVSVELLLLLTERWAEEPPETCMAFIVINIIV